MSSPVRRYLATRKAFVGFPTLTCSPEPEDKTENQNRLIPIR
jgi:hypothetical protein